MPDKLQIDHVNLGLGTATELFKSKSAVINFNTATDHTVVTAVAGKKIRVTGIKFSVANDVTTTWKSGSTQIWPAETWKAGGGMSDYWGPHGYFFETAEGQALVIALSAGVQLSGGINYVEV